MRYAVGLVAAVAVLWLLAVVVLVVARPKGLRAFDAARMMPDVVRLVRDLARDKSIPWRVRARVWLLLAWIASPIDAIPDVIPVIGLVDDAVVAYLVLRSVARSAGREVLARHWRGNAEGLAALEQLLRLDHDRQPPPAQ